MRHADHGRLRLRQVRRTVALLACCALLAGCGSSAEREVWVFASSSLADAFAEVGSAFESAHPGVAVRLHVAGTPQLVLQVEEGADAEVLASADPDAVARLADGGHLAGTPRPLARNRLAIAVPPGNPAGIAGLEDLTREDLRIGLCAPQVPCGRYARATLAAAGVEAVPVTNELSVRALANKVAFGELDAAIVYASDVVAAGDDLDGVALAESVVADYVVVALSDTDLAARFVAFATSAEAHAILVAHGFAEP